jgi:hypothetical protein
MKFTTVFIAAACLLSACSKSAPSNEMPSHSGRGPVPESWYKLPEEGASLELGSLPELGQDVDHLFAAQAAALPHQDPMADTTPGGDKPVDWVPWHLAILSSDFALAANGVFGALLYSGSADVQVNWVRANALLNASKLKTPIHSKLVSDLVIRGTATRKEVSRQLEPVIKAALAGGTIKNEANFRNSVLKAADDFRITAAQLNSVGKMDSQFPPSAFRLEMAFNAQGNLTPTTALGGTVNLRFDWIVPDSSFANTPTGHTAEHSPLGDALLRFAKSMAPDIEAAAHSVQSLQTKNYGLSSIRIGLGLTAQGNIGIAQGQASALGSIIFGDNDEEGGCFDPDGDGDCHNHPDHLAANMVSLATPDDDGIALIRPSPKPFTLKFAADHNVAFERQAHRFPVAVNAVQGQENTVFKIPHDKFQAGLRKAIEISSFFTDHAATINGDWKIQEIETEFDLSITGTTGLVTLQGTGELELEFEHKGI